MVLHFTDSNSPPRTRSETRAGGRRRLLEVLQAHVGRGVVAHAVLVRQDGAGRAARGSGAREHIGDGRTQRRVRALRVGHVAAEHPVVGATQHIAAALALALRGGGCLPPRQRPHLDLLCGAPHLPVGRLVGARQLEHRGRPAVGHDDAPRAECRGVEADGAGAAPKLEHRGGAHTRSLALEPAAEHRRARPEGATRVALGEAAAGEGELLAVGQRGQRGRLARQLEQLRLALRLALAFQCLEALHLPLADERRLRLRQLAHAHAEGRPGVQRVVVQVECLLKLEPRKLVVALGHQRHARVVRRVLEEGALALVGGCAGGLSTRAWNSAISPPSSMTPVSSSVAAAAAAAAAAVAMAASASSSAACSRAASR
eukprot:scaffold94276_cov57-Phaeocystis_antarctica.AAC.13